MKIEVLTEKQTNILLALAQYKFLTISQFKTLGIDRHDSNLRKALKPLLESKTKFVDRIMFSMYPKSQDLMRKNKLEYVYYLKPRAKTILLENQLLSDQDIRMPIGKSTFAYKDYYHRKITINCHIALCGAAKRESFSICFCEFYYDKIGNNRRDKNLRAKTRINISRSEYLIADAVFMIQTPKQKELYCLEVQNGKDTKLIVQKLKFQYLRALNLGSPSEKYKFERSNRVLVIFEFESMMRATMERLKMDTAFKYMHRHFLFKTVDNLQPFFHNWKLINDESEMMF